MGFLDQRQWMASLEQQGELRRIKAEVDWDREIGAISRRMLEKKGPALLFENIKGYADGRCSKLFVSGLGARSRLALALGFSHDAGNRELVQHVMKMNRETIPPVIVPTGPVKDVVVRGDAIDQTEFPVPKWHYLEGGRYIHTFTSIVTRDPDTGVIAGGVVTTLLDHACGQAVYMAIGSPTSIATLDLRIDYMRAAEPGLDIFARAHCYKLTRRIAFVRATAYDKDPEDPVATAQAAFMLGTRGPAAQPGDNRTEAEKAS